MISTIGVHQPPPMPPPPSSSASSSSATMGHPMRRQAHSASPAMMTLQPNGAVGAPFCRRQLGLTCLDLTDCVSVEDSGLKMIVETCPQLQYLFLRRCVNITGDYLLFTVRAMMMMISAPPSFRALSRNSKFGTQRIAPYFMSRSNGGGEDGAINQIAKRSQFSTRATSNSLSMRSSFKCHLEPQSGS